MVSKKALNTLLASAIVMTVAGVPAAQAQEKEKCYGVVKAGANDCAAASGAHSCAGSATVSGDGNEWIALPKGVCDKLVNGSVTPASGTPPTANASEMPSGSASGESTEH